MWCGSPLAAYSLPALLPAAPGAGLSARRLIGPTFTTALNASSKNLANTFFPDVEALCQGLTDSLLRTLEQQLAPLRYRLPVNRRAEYAPLEILDSDVDYAIHLCKIGIEAIREPLDKLAQKDLIGSCGAY